MIFTFYISLFYFHLSLFIFHFSFFIFHFSFFSLLYFHTLFHSNHFSFFIFHISNQIFHSFTNSTTIHLIYKKKINKLFFNNLFHQLNFKTRPDTRLPQSRAGGQGPYLRSLDHLGRSSEAKDRKKNKKSKV